MRAILRNDNAVILAGGALQQGDQVFFAYGRDEVSHFNAQTRRDVVIVRRDGREDRVAIESVAQAEGLPQPFAGPTASRYETVVAEPHSGAWRNRARSWFTSLVAPSTVQRVG